METAKSDRLNKVILKLNSVVVAFSGGVDSTLLLTLCAQKLGRELVIAATADSTTMPRRELAETQKIVKKLGVRHVITPTAELENDYFADNPPDRCYYCKQELFSELRNLAEANGFKHIVYGATTDDLQDYRPGIRAGEEAGAKAPLLEADFDKKDVRELSHRLGLSTANKPATACLASRIPYGTRITSENLFQVEQAEDLLKQRFEFSQVRVRHHGDIARIEVPASDFSQILTNGYSNQIVSELKQLGFLYVTLDLTGFRSGSMNEIFKK